MPLSEGSGEVEPPQETGTMSLFSRSFLGLYRGLWAAATPLVRRNRRLSQGFEDRIALTGEPFAGRDAVDADTGPLIWVQAASGGEAALVRALLREAGTLPEFVARSPRFFCTTWTAQGVDVLRTIAPPSGISLLARYVPLDNPALMRQAVALARPACVVLLETEIWPGLMAACREADVPLLLLNARMTPKSLSGYRLLRPLLREIRPDRILAISEDDAARFADIFGPEGVSVMPNIKFDGATLTPPVGADPFAGLAAEADPAMPRLALASVRQEEEEALLGILPRLLAGGAALAVAPRHMHRVDVWRKALVPYGAVLRSELLAGTATSPAGPLIWDTFGDLALLYAHVDAAFVGGSLAPLGGQNFLEAPALGTRALVGPHLNNFLWVGEEIFQTGTVERVADAEALAVALPKAAVGRQADRAAAAGETRRRFAEWLAPRTGGSRVAAQAVADVCAKG